MTDTPATKMPSGKRAKAAAAAKSAANNTAEAARGLAAKTAAGIEANPMGVLAGGIALGALAGAFLPRSARETKLLGSVGKRVTDTVQGAVEAAKDTTKSELDVLGLTRNAARDQAGKLLDGLVAAIASAATAALAAAREKPVTPPAPPATPVKPARVSRAAKKDSA